MARVSLPDMRPWGRRSLTIPPDSRTAWMQLAIATGRIVSLKDISRQPVLAELAAHIDRQSAA